MLLRDLTHDMLPPQAALLSDDVVLLALPDGMADDGVLPCHPILKPPYGTVTVQGAAGPHRIAAVRIPASSFGAGRTASLVLGSAAAQDGIGPVALATDATGLASELDAASCRRLLGFLLGFCRTAFGLGGNAGFAGTCARLARLCAQDAGLAEPVAHATPAWTVLSGVRAPQDASFYVIGTDRVRHSAAPASSDASGLRLIEPQVGDGDLLLALCDQPLLWTVRAAATAGTHLPDVVQPSAAAPAAHGALRAACLRLLGAAGGRTAALLREVQALSPAAPRRHDDPASALGAALETALPDGEGGLFLRGWLRDPLDLIEDVQVRTPVGTAPIDPAQLHRVRRPELAGRYAKSAFRDTGQAALHGFVAHVRDPSGGLCPQPSLALRLRSGNVVEATAPIRHLPAATARDAVLSCVPPDQVTPAMLDGCLAPAAAALHRQAMLAGRRSSGVVAVDVVQIGAPAMRQRRPAVSIVVPLYRNLDFLRFQVAALAGDRECRERAELVYALDSPEQRTEVEHLLRGLHGLYELPFTLVVMPCNLGYAAANNAAVAAASATRAPTLLLLNSDVVPAQPGWLGAMEAALAARPVGAAGPKLLFDDGSIQHAGLFFERDRADGVWFNQHYHKGMPRRWPAAQRSRWVPGVTGAALMVRRALFELVGGISEDYIVGDYEDSDFCLKLQGAGAAVAYVPEAELYHFERRSIRLHAGYSRTLAAQYNRRLHHRRWDAAITAIMAPEDRRPRGGAAGTAPRTAAMTAEVAAA